MFDRYMITVHNKQTGDSFVFDEVTKFGLFMYELVNGLSVDPTTGQGKVVVYKSHKGLLTRLIERMS